MSALSKKFTATLQKSPNRGGWTYVVMPRSAETRVRIVPVFADTQVTATVEPETATAGNPDVLDDEPAVVVPSVVFFHVTPLSFDVATRTAPVTLSVQATCTSVPEAAIVG